MVNEKIVNELKASAELERIKALCEIVLLRLEIIAIETKKFQVEQELFKFKMNDISIFGKTSGEL